MTDETINLPPLPSPFGIIAPESTDDTLYSRADLAAYARAYARVAVLADRQSPEAVEMRDMLKEARQQLPLAAQFWNEDDEPERRRRNVRLVMELIAKIDAAMEAKP